MKRIYKYPLAVTDSQEIDLPTGAEILCVQAQHGIPCLWALVDPSAARELRAFATYGTGHQHDGSGTYVGTYQLNGGALVFHVFERGRPGVQQPALH